MKENRCVICDNIFFKDAKKFNFQGHDAKPIKEGKCCDRCNLTVVIPARLKEIKDLRWKRIKSKTELKGSFD